MYYQRLTYENRCFEFWLMLSSLLRHELSLPQGQRDQFALLTTLSGIRQMGLESPPVPEDYHLDHVPFHWGSKKDDHERIQPVPAQALKPAKQPPQSQHHVGMTSILTSAWKATLAPEAKEEAEPTDSITLEKTLDPEITESCRQPSTETMNNVLAFRPRPRLQANSQQKKKHANRQSKVIPIYRKRISHAKQLAMLSLLFHKLTQPKNTAGKGKKQVVSWLLRHSLFKTPLMVCPTTSHLTPRP